jgi:hypothetical protein
MSLYVRVLEALCSYVLKRPSGGQPFLLLSHKHSLNFSWMLHWCTWFWHIYVSVSMLCLQILQWGRVSSCFNLYPCITRSVHDYCEAGLYFEWTILIRIEWTVLLQFMVYILQWCRPPPFHSLDDTVRNEETIIEWMIVWYHACKSSRLAGTQFDHAQAGVCGQGSSHIMGR